MHRIVPATRDDVYTLAFNLRPEEIDELFAAHYPEKVLSIIHRCRDTSWEVWSCWYGDNYLGMTGVIPNTILSNEATAWLLTTPEMKKHPAFLLRRTKAMIQRWHRNWSVLNNYIDARYEDSLRWARWVGFEVYPPAPFGPFRLPFHYIESRSD